MRGLHVSLAPFIVARTIHYLNIVHFEGDSPLRLHTDESISSRYEPVVILYPMYRSADDEKDAECHPSLRSD